MVGPPHSRHPRRRRGALCRQCGVGAERSDRAMQQRARLEVRDEADEIADIRIREVQREGVALAAYLRVVIADRFDRQHRNDLVVSLPRGACIVPAAHVFRSE